jgi:hypothetical protein
VFGWRTKAEFVLSSVGLPSLKYQYCDLKGVEHTIEVTADSLYEAVAQALPVFRGSEWVETFAEVRQQFP